MFIEKDDGKYPPFKEEEEFSDIALGERQKVSECEEAGERKKCLIVTH